MVTPVDLEKARTALVVELSALIPNQQLDCESIAQAIDHLIQVHFAIRDVK